tara:strand:- start:689 stop:1828 length:1140 start_codon:yes stop_codon:yes gene_type:complete
MFTQVIKKNKTQILTISLVFFFGCAPQQKTFSIDDVEKQRTQYLDGKLKSLSVLVEVYQDKDQPYNIRTAALRVLAESSHPIALEAIQESVSNSSLFELDLLIDAINYLSKHGNEQSTISLLEGLKSSENMIMDIRESMINAINKLGTKDQIITLLDLWEVSRTQHHRMNYLLSQTLGAMDDERAMQMLIEIANDPSMDISIRKNVLEVLSLRDSDELVDFFANLLDDPKSTLQMRKFAFNNMGDIDGQMEARMISVLLESYQSGKEDYFTLLESLLNAMKEFKDPSIAEKLKEIAKSNDYPRTLRLKALQALAAQQDQSNMDELLSILENPENYVYYNEIIDLVDLSNKKNKSRYEVKLREIAYKAYLNYSFGGGKNK